MHCFDVLIFWTLMTLAAGFIIPFERTEKRYDQNCFFSPMNCQHRLPSNAIIVKDDGSWVSAFERCPKCALRMKPSSGFNVRRRKAFRT
ncbi:hypothetical protein AAVH_12755 [Aphelenchoides avenae]|nr:hypothetical protein AAVH_12755 [Aphelenchus avenae]